MENENLVSVNFEQLTNFLSELESLNVTIDDEAVQTNLTEINENLKLLNEYLIPTDEELLLLEQQEDLIVEEIELENSEVLEDEPDLYLENLQSINDNLVILNETVQNQRTDEISDLEIKSYGSNIIILFLLVVYGLFKGVSKIFGLVTKAV